ncbi:MAG: alkaline phosphatase family protein [Kiritimatiellaeota bacterium]|nr:alkaline phosphatase family protein [Kiritimatiellota bacterium]
MRKILIVQVAGLGYDFATACGAAELGGCAVRPMQPVFPALTCTAQATLRTGLAPAQHGIVANGFFDTTLRKPMFWEQSARLVHGGRFWEAFRARGGTAGMAFFQQSLGEAVDFLVSPAPIHTHGGGMIMGCYSRPADLHSRLSRHARRPFRLHHYWGPLASVKSSEWIADAIAGFLSDPDAPDLLITYLPGLDYDLQRFGPGHPKARAAMACVQGELARLAAAARANGFEIVIFGDYAITPVTRGAVFPNRALREAGLLAVRDVRGMRYPDFYGSAAYALPDHQVAMVHCLDPAAGADTARVLGALPGVGRVMGKAAQEAAGIAHLRAGDLLLVAEPGAWFAYPWWADAREAPDYAAHVDIHNKPGFDPCELFFGRNPFHVSMDTAKVRGTHGLAGEGCAAAFAASAPLRAETVAGLAHEMRDWLVES